MKTPKNFKHLALLLGLVLLLSACGSGTATVTPDPIEEVTVDSVIAEGRVVPVRDVRLNFAARGPVEEILIEEGEEVAGEEALIELGDTASARASLRAAELELKQAQVDLDDFLRTADLAAAQAWQDYLQAQVRRAEAERAWEDLDLDALEEDIDDARIEVEEREVDLEDARDELEKYQDVAEDNPDREAAEEDVEEAREDLNEARRELEAAVREIDSVRAELDAALAAEAEAEREYRQRAEEEADPDQLEILEARVSAGESRVEAADHALENYTLKAPFPGTVTDIFVEPGMISGPESRAVQLADLSEFLIETSDLTELEVVRIEEGMAVEIVPDALPDVTLTGAVEEISRSFTTQAGDILYTVKIRMDETDPALRWGMTVEVRFLTDGE